MKKLTTLFLAGALMFGAAACANNARTSADAPDTTQANPEAPDADAAQSAKEDATSQVRRDQLNADIRAREERNNVLNDGSAQDRDDGDLASQVRSKLEANLPASHLVVEGQENGDVTVSGTVPTQAQLERIEPLAQEIKGVQRVNVLARVAPAQPATNN